MANYQNRCSPISCAQLPPGMWRITRCYYREVLELREYLCKYEVISAQNCDIVRYGGVRWVVSHVWQELRLPINVCFPQRFVIEMLSADHLRIYDLEEGRRCVKNSSWCYEIMDLNAEK